MTIRPFDGLPTTAETRRVVEVVNRINQGKLNVASELTLTANVASTTLTDSRISPQAFIGLMPTTANAATALATTYIGTRLNGSATITHANNAQTDRTFALLIIG